MELLSYNPVPGQIIDIMNIGTLRLDPLNNMPGDPSDMNAAVRKYVQEIPFHEDGCISLLFQIRRLNNCFLKYYIMESDRLFKYENLASFFFDMNTLASEGFLSKLLCFIDNFQHHSSFYDDILIQNEMLVSFINQLNLSEEVKRKLLSICFAPNSFFKELLLTLSEYEQMWELASSVFPTYFRKIEYDYSSIPQKNFDLTEMKITYSISYINDQEYYFKPCKDALANLIIGRNFGAKKENIDISSVAKIFCEYDNLSVIELLSSKALTIRELSKRLRMDVVRLRSLLDTLYSAKIVDMDMIQRTVLYRLNSEYLQAVLDELRKICGLPDKNHFIVNEDYKYDTL